MEKIRILFLAANPANTSRLHLDEEIRAITEKIRLAEYRDSIDLIDGWAVRADDLLELLNRHKPHIVHFSGHGSSSGAILVVKDNQQAQQISPEAIRALFATLRDNIQIVMLNACYSKIQAQAIIEEIDYAIGMNTAIGDQAAIIFAASFYHAIGCGRSVHNAFEQGKAALLLQGLAENDTPEMLIKAGANPSQTFFKSALSETNHIVERANIPNYTARLAYIGERQIQILNFIQRKSQDGNLVPQSLLEDQYNRYSHSEVYYRLEQLYLLAFIDKQTIEQQSGVCRYAYCLSEEYCKELEKGLDIREIPDTEPKS